MRCHSLVACCLTVLLSACSSATHSDVDASPLKAEFARSLGSGQAIFVLDRAGAQATDPITLFDHVCQGVRYQTVVHDTVVLWADGRARRAFTFDQLTDGAVRSSDHLSFSGRWRDFTPRSAYYFSDGPSIALSLAPDAGEMGAPYEMDFRIVAPGALATFSGMGGSCPGSPNDGHSTLFTFTRR